MDLIYDHVDIAGAGAPGERKGSRMNIGDQMVIEAYKHVGKPYVWATHGPNTFDCSGLVHYVVLQVTGTWISPGTDAQQHMGSPVSTANLRPGDLIFYGDPPGGGIVTHVGIYVSPGVMIDAANENTGVRVTDPFGPWYGERFMFARRLYPYVDGQQPDPDPPPHVIGDGDTVTGRVVLYAAADPIGTYSTASADELLCVTGPALRANGADFLPVRVQGTGVDAFILAEAIVLDTIGGCAAPDPDPDPDPIPGRTPSQWSAGDRIRVVDDPLNVRTSYPSGTVIGTYSTGEEVCMVGGPHAANGYHWIQVEGRLNGWVAEDFCERIGIQTCGGTPPPDPDPDPPVQYTHHVTGSALNLRTAPGGALLGTMPVGTRLRIISGPVAQGGYTWYEVEAEHFGTGWCVNGFDPI